VAWFVLAYAPRAAQALDVTVVYPQIGAPYAEIFDEILRGAQSSRQTNIRQIQVSGEADPAEVRKQVAATKPDAVITLGPQGYQLARDGGIPDGVPVVSGAVFLQPDGISGVSLAADPQLLFAYLHDLAPATRKVHVVYDPAQNGWLIALARQAAAKNGLQLVEHQETSLRDAVRRYRDLIEAGLNDDDAIWLPVDTTTVYDKVVLPLLLQAAWDKRLVVFSSKPTHAQKGALFSLYPNNTELGRQLVDLAARQVQQGRSGKTVIEPMKKALLAVNMRTAGHLGLRFSADQEREFALVFPTR